MQGGPNEEVKLTQGDAILARRGEQVSQQVEEDFGILALHAIALLHVQPRPFEGGGKGILPLSLSPASDSSGGNNGEAVSASAQRPLDL